MESNVNTNPEYQLQDRISRIAEGVLMLGSSLIGVWLLSVLIFSFMQ